jgi:hypothetical protein
MGLVTMYGLFSGGFGIKKIVVKAGGFILSVTRAALGRGVCFKNNFSRV